MNKPIKMIISQNAIQLIPNVEQCGFDKILTLNRFTFEIIDYFLIQNIEQEINIYGIVGCYQIANKLNLLYISEATIKCQINNQAIYEIVKIQNLLQNQLNATEQQFTSTIEKYLSKCTYFSLSYDLTIPLAYQNESESSQRSFRYWWNFHGYKIFLKSNIPKCWCIKIIQGFVGVGHCQLITDNNSLIYYILISRRETLRGGTRYNHRGIDEQGAAANTVETESLIQYQDKLYCHLQIRGSAPVFWEQKGIRAVSQLTSTQEQTKITLKIHLEYLKKTYGPLFLVDLMAKNKPNESLISNVYRDTCIMIQMPQTIHNHIDFNQYCKNYKFENLNEVIKLSEIILKQQSFTMFQNGKLMNLQNGIVRTNCLDCLDRTNVFQTKIAFFITNLILKDIGIAKQKEFGCESILDLSDKEIVHPFIKMIKILWGESGDHISKLYAGTNSSTTKMQKTGGGSWTGMFEHSIKGFQRFYNQNITDDEKQNVYLYIIGKMNQNVDNDKAFIGYVDKIQQQSIQQTSNLIVMIVNSNLENNSIKDFYHLIDCRQIPQILIICLQNVDSICQSFNFIKDQLSYIIKERFGQYICLVNGYAEQIYSYIFVKSNIIESFKSSYSQIIKNEEKEIALIQQILYEDFRIQILNCNFEAKFLPEYEQTLQNNLQDCDIQFLCGLQKSKISINETIDQFYFNNPQDTIAKLFMRDEISEYLTKLSLLKDKYQEANITFQPRSDLKSWTDRILYGSNINLDAFNTLVYEQIQVPYKFGIRMLIQIDLKLLELSGQKQNESDEDEEGIEYSQKFYGQFDQKEEDDFEVIT